MGQTEATRQADFITPPRAGQIAVVAATAVASSLDLRTVGIQTPNMGSANASTPVGLPGHYTSIEADGTDIWVLFGPTLASVTGANAPVIATTGVNVAGCCLKISFNGVMNVKPEVGVDNFIGFITAAATSGVLRICKTSP